MNTQKDFSQEYKNIYTYKEPVRNGFKHITIYEENSVSKEDIAYIGFVRNKHGFGLNKWFTFEENKYTGIIEKSQKIK